MTNPILTGELVPQAQVKDALILAAGPMSKQPLTERYRVVLAAKKQIDGQFQYVVYDHMVPRDRPEYLCNGYYFGIGPDELVKATIKFSEQVAEHAEYLKSIFRD